MRSSGGAPELRRPAAAWQARLRRPWPAEEAAAAAATANPEAEAAVRAKARRWPAHPPPNEQGDPANDSVVVEQLLEQRADILAQMEAVLAARRTALAAAADRPLQKNHGRPPPAPSADPEPQRPPSAPRAGCERQTTNGICAPTTAHPSYFAADSCRWRAFGCSCLRCGW